MILIGSDELIDLEHLELLTTRVYTGFVISEMLVTVKIQHNKIQNFKIGDCPRLKEVFLSYNRIFEFEISGSLPSLKVLDLSYNKLRSLETPRLPSLETLALQTNNLSSFQYKSFDGSSLFPLLKNLDLSYNYIVSFELDLVSLPNLQILDLLLNQIEVFEFEHHGTLVPNLKELILARNSLQNFRISVHLPFLGWLDLSNNSISEVKLNMNFLPVLESIYLGFNSLVLFEIDSSGPNSLKELNMENNHLQEFRILAPLSKLELLLLTNNSLSSFEVASDLIPNIGTLHIGNNMIEHLCFNYPSLRNLSLGNNKITSVEITEPLPNLARLSLRKNQLDTFSVGKNLPNLWDLDVEDNHNLSILDLWMRSYSKDEGPAWRKSVSDPLVRLDRTQIRFVDKTVFHHVESPDVKVREHQLGVLEVIASRFHGGLLPIFEEIKPEIMV